MYESQDFDFVSFIMHVIWVQGYMEQNWTSGTSACLLWCALLDCESRQWQSDLTNITYGGRSFKLHLSPLVLWCHSEVFGTRFVSSVL